MQTQSMICCLEVHSEALMDLMSSLCNSTEHLLTINKPKVLQNADGEFGISPYLGLNPPLPAVSTHSYCYRVWDEYLSNQCQSSHQSCLVPCQGLTDNASGSSVSHPCQHVPWTLWPSAGCHYPPCSWGAAVTNSMVLSSAWHFSLAFTQWRLCSLSTGHPEWGNTFFLPVSGDEICKTNPWLASHSDSCKSSLFTLVNNMKFPVLLIILTQFFSTVDSTPCFVSKRRQVGFWHGDFFVLHFLNLAIVF